MVTPERSDWYPLPPDYEELTPEGQRLARVNACSLQRSADEYVRAWDFFRIYYLHQMEGCLLYGGDIAESPDFHYEMVKAMAEHQYATRACPRGFAKSTITDENILLRVLTRREYPVLLCLAGFSLLKERMDIFQRTLYNNSMIQDDFRGLIPGRSEGRFNLEVLEFNHGSRIRGVVTGGKKRGTKPRPKWIVLDDPEFDPSESTDMAKVKREFRNQLFRVLIPCGARDSQFWWPGTIISRQLSLYQANAGRDPQYSRWNNRIYKAYTEVDGKKVPLWPEQFDLEWLAGKKADLGAAFASEYLNSPGEGDTATFQIHPTLNTYSIDRNKSIDPHTDISPVKYHLQGGTTLDGPIEIREMEEPLCDLLARLQIVALLDYAPTHGPDSDYNAITIQGFDRKNDVMWVLDAWHGKVNEEAVLKKLLELGQLWKPRAVGIESVGMQIRFYEQVNAFLKDLPNIRWSPRVYPIRYKSVMSKETRIGNALGWRFSTFRIKLPANLRHSQYWSDLFEQLENFQMETRNGNLQHDDLIDTLAMSQFINKSSERAKAHEDIRPMTAMDYIKRGELVNEQTGISYITSLDSGSITCEDIRAIAEYMQEDQPKRSLSIRIGYE